ncbi:MAG: hypothetical protein ACYC2T_01080 [Bacillota bacterium]
MGNVVFILLLLALLYWAAMMRTRTGGMFRQDKIPDRLTPSPLSRSMGELVGLAGGIYVSLLVLVTFLEISLPDRIDFMGMNMEPLALIALSIAIIQQVLLSTWGLIKKKFVVR